jgi:hypothetical protein
MVTAATIVALRATALGDCGGSCCNEDGCRNSGGKKRAMAAVAAMALVMIALVTLTIAHFVTCSILLMPSPVTLAIAHFVTRKVIANAIAHVVAVAIAFVSVGQRGRWQGQQEQLQL